MRPNTPIGGYCAGPAAADNGHVATLAPGTEQRGLNVVLIEDHLAVRKGFELLLRGMGHHVIGVSDNAAEGAGLIARRRPDVAIVDMNLPGESGGELCRRLVAGDPASPVLIYTGISDLEELQAGLDCGARGFCLKTAPPQELDMALQAVATGGTYVDAGLRPLLASASAGRGVLSAREKEVLSLLAAGRTGEQAAEELCLSPHTVRTHIRNVITKLGANTRTHAAVLALSRGEISPRP